jgi:hypothetical protein
VIAHLLELEVSLMRHGAKLATLKDQEDDSTNDRHEVEGQVHEVADDSLRRESHERLLNEFAETSHRITAGLEISPFGYDICLVLLDQSLHNVSYD